MSKGKLVVPLLMALLLVPSVALAENTTTPKGDVEDTTIPALQVISPTEYFKVTDKTVTETEDSYRIKGSVKTEWKKCSGCIRQIVLSVDETNEALKCVYNGIPGTNNPKKVNFEIEVSKSKVNKIIEENNQATVIAVRGAGWSCGWEMNQYPDERKGIKVHRFTPGIPVLSIVIVILVVVGAGGGYLIYKKT